MKIFLVNPPFIEAYGQYAAAAKMGAQPQMPLGICYIAAVLENMGHEIKLIDASVEEMSIIDVVEEVKKWKPDIVGTTSTTPIYAATRMILEKVKKSDPNIITILGGFHITALPERTMQECVEADYGVVGEGEETIRELIECIENKTNPQDVKGIIYRDEEGKHHLTSPRPPITDLDKIPHPARHLLKMDRYVWSVQNKGFVPVTSILTQRGCPFACIFCGVQTMFPGKARYRNMTDIMDEIEGVVKKHNVKHIMFCDDTLTLNQKKVEQMCKEIKERDLKFTFEGYTRANTVTPELLKKLREVGLVRLSFGVETGNEHIMKAIKKGVKLEDITQAYKWCHEEGIETRCSIMIGHPFETKETIEQTIAFTNSLKCYQAYINITTPYPGSELYLMAKEGYGGTKLLTDDWREYRRYGNSVMEMNDLTVKDLIEYQKKAYKAFYMRPHIIWYNLKRAGFKAGILNSWAFLKSVILS